jgi:hypothetical protein
MPFSDNQYDYSFRTVNVVWGGLIFQGPFEDPAFSISYAGNLFDYLKGIGGSGTRSANSSGLEAGLSVTLHSTSPTYARLLEIGVGDFFGTESPRRLVISSRQLDGVELHKAPVAWIERISDVTHSRSVSMRQFSFKLPTCVPKATPQSPLVPV